jgi:hypothetical protein
MNLFGAGNIVSIPQDMVCRVISVLFPAVFKGYIQSICESNGLVYMCFSIRTHSVKFLECIVLLQTYPEVHSMKRANDFSLEDVPLTLKIARRRKLEEEAK